MKYILNILIFILLVIDTFAYYLVTFCLVDRYFIIGLVFFIPVILLVGLRKKCVNEKVKKEKIIVKTTSLLIIGGLAVFCLFCFILARDNMAIITKSQYYSRILTMKIDSNKDLLKHFPKEIPEDAQNIQFYYTSRWNK